MRIAIKLILCVALLLVSANMLADNFQDYARQVREEVWNWDKPEFKNYQVPEEYTNESAVVLARHQEIEVRTKKIVMLHRLYYTETDRRMIKINDKVSLEKYSEITFTEKIKMSTMGIGHKNRVQTILGARIVKPDGTIQEVNVDEAVVVTEGKKDKESYRKLAISDLQTGDIIDYFICEVITLDEMNLPPVWFTGFSAYPTLSYTARCVFNTKHLTIEYAVMNGADDFTRSELSDEETLLELKGTHLPKIAEGRHIAYMRDAPMIRMHILNNKNVMVGRSSNARKSGIYKLGENLSKKDLINDAEFRNVNSIYYKEATKIFYKGWKKYLKNYFKENTDLTAIEKANYIHQYLHLEWPGGYNYNAYAFMWAFHQLLIEAGVPHEYILISSRYGPRMDDILTSRDLDDAIRVGDKYYTYPYGLQVAGWLYQNNQGQEAWVNNRWIDINGKIKPDNGFKGEFIVTPTTTVQENKSIQSLEVTFAEGNPLELLINREVTRTGALKGSYQNLLFSYELWDETIRKQLSIDETYWEMLKRHKYSTKYIDNRKVEFGKTSDRLKDSARVEVTNFHEITPKKLLNYQLVSLGTTSGEPEFKYKVQYILEGLVKKAGNNWVVDAGKLIGSQWEPSEDERKRTIHSHIPTPRAYINEIKLRIPAGYEALETDKLNRVLENEYGTFRSTTVVEGDVLKITTCKEYKQTFIPVDKWNQFLAVMDEAIKFQALSVVLKRN